MGNLLTSKYFYFFQSVIDAQWLGTQVQMYYASENPERLRLLRLFNQEPEKFDHISVIDQLDQEMSSGAFVNK